MSNKNVNSKSQKQKKIETQPFNVSTQEGKPSFYISTISATKNDSHSSKEGLKTKNLVSQELENNDVNIDTVKIIQPDVTQQNDAFTDNDNDELTNQLLKRVFCRVRQIKEKNPDVSAEIDMHERLVRLQLKAIKNAINKLPDEDKELVTILVVSGINRMVEDLLDIKHDEIKDTDARNIDMHQTKKLKKKQE